MALAETVTLVAESHVPAQAYEEAVAEFTEDETAALVSLIGIDPYMENCFGLGC